MKITELSNNLLENIFVRLNFDDRVNFSSIKHFKFLLKTSWKFFLTEIPIYYLLKTTYIDNDQKNYFNQRLPYLFEKLEHTSHELIYNNNHVSVTNKYGEKILEINNNTINTFYTTNDMVRLMININESNNNTYEYLFDNNFNMKEIIHYVDGLALNIAKPKNNLDDVFLLKCNFNINNCIEIYKYSDVATYLKDRSFGAKSISLCDKFSTNENGVIVNKIMDIKPRND